MKLRSNRRSSLFPAKKGEPPKRIEREEIDKAPIGQMNQDIQQMVSNRVEFAQLIIKRKGELNKRTGRFEPVQGSVVFQIPDFFLFFDLEFSIKNKRNTIGVAVNHQGNGCN